MTDTDASPKGPTQSVLTKKRYHDIEASLTTIFADLHLDDEEVCVQAVKNAMARIRDIMKFDPERKLYTPEMGKKIVERRKKRAEELGITVHALTKGHEFYQAHREERVKAASESRKRRQEREKQQVR